MENQALKEEAYFSDILWSDDLKKPLSCSIFLTIEEFIIGQKLPELFLFEIICIAILGQIFASLGKVGNLMNLTRSG